MSTFQKLVIVGNTGNDPQITTFEGGGIIARVAVATTENWKDKQTGEKKSLTEWHSCIFRNQLAEIVEKYVKKGDKILVEGVLRTRKWTDKDNIERYSTEVNVQSMTMLGGKSENTGSAVNNYQQQNSGTSSTFAPKEEEHDDLPF